MFLKSIAAVCLTLFATGAAAQMAAPAAPAAAPAAASGIKRTVLQKADLGDRDMVMATAEIASGMAIGRHFHHGTETGYILEGESVLMIDGEAPRLVKAGDSWVIPAGKVHDARAQGDKPVKVLAIYVVEKGKPLAVPAP